ncbi:hypothetical protein N7541_000440 [Penicillium brevicompactum]|uniref:GPI anchored cell wall protein n=1 Tax=Penicillium brevicompactum TaxID=5074 RepID=A0A9W9QAH4_PENBR|nr:uncharacterized protein N7506_001946 [Penicillium brevicompactum]KAJ5329394.1 hypothetical protein N7452_009784 [Penicillium brevicompactum]KAJ5348693.1 hypothetical protein N7506_001946 [Penicillium brevicompactum]KAJ5366499.1 hypothetical protein N7541_000440 [Penicillium brevicompactum]
MRITSFLVATLATLVTAAEQSTQSTTHRPYLGAGFSWASRVPNYQSTAASVAGITSHLTTYEISCLTNAPKSVCNIETPWTLIQGSTTFSFTGKYTASTTASVGTVTVDREFDCSFTSTSRSASCSFEYHITGSHNGASYSTSTSSSTSSLPTESMKYSSLLITGGIAKITSAQSTSTTGAANPTAKAMITGAPMGAAAAVAIAAML